MSRFNTGNAIPSISEEDCYDNMACLDQAMNSTEPTWRDRFNVEKPTIDAALKSAGFMPAGFDFVTGGTLQPGDRNKAVYNPAPNGDNNWYRWNGAFPKEIAANSQPNPKDENNWVPVELNQNNTYPVTDPMLFGAKGDGIADDTQAFLAAIKTNKKIMINNHHLVSGVLSIKKIEFGPNGKLIFKPNTNLTISEIVDTTQQIFDNTSGGVVNLTKPFVRPDWWGDVENTLNYAEAALPIFGGVVQLGLKVYKKNNHKYGFGDHSSARYFSKDNVTWNGVKPGVFSSDFKSLEKGTIVKGMLLAYANNIEFNNIGIDSGRDHVDLEHGGVTSPALVGEGLLLTYPSDEYKNNSSLRVGAKLHNITSLCPGPLDQVHAIIIAEGFTRVLCTGEIKSCYGWHGIVIKAAEVTCEQLTSYCAGGEGVIIKSDSQSTAKAYDININNITIKGTGPFFSTPYTLPLSGHGLQFNPAAGDIDRVQIKSALIEGYNQAITIVGNNTVSNIQLGKIILDAVGSKNPENSVGINWIGAGPVINTSIDDLCVRNFAIGGAFNISGKAAIGTLSGANIRKNFLDIQGGVLGVSSVLLQRGAHNPLKIFKIRENGKLKICTFLHDLENNISTLYDDTDGGLKPVLHQDWVEVSGGDKFNINLSGGKINISGLLKPLGNSKIIASLPAWCRPTENKRFIIPSFLSNNTHSFMGVVVDVGGNITLQEGAAIPDGITFISLSGISF